MDRLIAMCCIEFMHKRPAAKGNGRDGSVMLETILAIPLLMVLIGGVLWTGDLVLAKAKLVVADRYAAWNTGNRHRLNVDIRGEINKKDQNKEPQWFPFYGDVGALHGGGTKERWWHVAYASVPLRITMPLWTKGWFLGSVMWGPDYQAPGYLFDPHDMFGRDIEGDEHHVVLMRTAFSVGEDYFRNWEGHDLASPWTTPRWPWVSIPEEPWYPDLDTELPDPQRADGQDYERHDSYVRWSE